MALVKVESSECELKQMLLSPLKWEAKPVSEVKQEAQRPVAQDESGTGDDFHLKIITVQEAKKEEMDYWEVDAFETSVEINRKAHNVNQGLSLQGLNDSCENGSSVLRAGGNLAQSLIHTGEKPNQHWESFINNDSPKTHTRNRECVKLNGKKYCCSHCGKTFATLIHFIVHQQIHRGDGKERPFTCSLCGKSFYRERGLKTHQQRHKGERQHRCSKCGKLFSVKSLLLSHQRSHKKRERLHQCSKCAQSFTSKANFERHMQIHSEETLYSCPQCKKYFSTECSLNRHKQTHIRKEANSCFKPLATKEKIYSCSHCSRTFTLLTHYIVHQQIHRGEGTGERPFRCLQCGKRFYREHGLKLHEQSHRSEKVHCCSQCGKSFSAKSLLNSHKCTRLKKRRRFTLKSTFESHIQIHSRQKNYTVSPCAVKSLPAEYSRSRHKETHIGKEHILSVQHAASKPKSYCCSHCGRTFNTLTNYIVHQQIHRGEGREERPFCCSQCGKRFYREGSLKKHHQIHTGGRSHQCSQCGKSFRTKSVLLTHQNVHERQKLHHHLKHDGRFASENSPDEDTHVQSSETVHRCSWCGEMFSAEYLLITHKQSHCKKASVGCFKQIQTKKYCCSTCGKVFTTLTNFVVHQQIHRAQGRGQMPVYFSQSGKCFYRENSLKSHQQTPTREMPPENDSILNSKVHADKRRNEGLRSYPCSFCEKTYTCSSALKQHQQIHIREKTRGNAQLQNSTGESFLGGSSFTNNNYVLTEISGGGKAVLGKDGKRETNPLETLPKFDMDDPSIEHSVHSVHFSDLQNTETCGDMSERPHIGFDTPLFYPEDVCQTVESTGSTSAVKPGAVQGKSVGAEVLNTHNPGTSFENEERPRNSGKISLVPSYEDPLESDLKPEAEHCNWRAVSVNEMKEENNDFTPLEGSHVAEDLQLLKVAPEETKKEEGKCKQGFSVKTEFSSTDLKENSVYFNRHIQNHSSNDMENFTTQGSATFHRPNQTEETYPHVLWVNNIEKDLQNSRGGKRSFQQIPSGNKMYCCSHCGRTFNTSVKYVVHLQIHRREGKEERPFKCSQCGKSFYREEGLKAHQQSHTAHRSGAGPYSHTGDRTDARPYSHTGDWSGAGPYSHTGDRSGAGPYSHTGDRSGAGAGPYSHTGDRSGAGPYSHTGDRSGAGPYSHTGDRSGAGPYSHTGDRSGAGPYSHTGDRSGAGPYSHTGDRSGTGPYSHTGDRSGAGPYSHTGDRSGTGPYSHTGDRSGAGPYSHTADRSGAGPHSGRLTGTSALTGQQQNDAAEKLHRCPQCDKSFACHRAFWEHQQIHTNRSTMSYCGDTLTDSVLKQQQAMNTGVMNEFISSASNEHPLEEMLTETPKGSTLRPKTVEFPVCTVSFSGATNGNVQMIDNIKSIFEREEKPVRSVKKPSQECILAPKFERHCDWQLESKDQMKEEDMGQIPISADCAEEIPLLKIITLDEMKMEDEGESSVLQSSSDINPRIPTADRRNGSSACATATESSAPFTPVHAVLHSSHCGKSNTAEDNQQTNTSDSCHFQQTLPVDKSYSCARCGKSFTTLTNYFVHLQIHRGERPFSCSQCGKSYYKEESLKTHQQSHTGGKH